MAESKVAGAVANHVSFAANDATVPVALPTGLAVGAALRVYVASSVGPTIAAPAAPAGWTIKKAITAMGSGACFVLERTGGWQTADGAMLAVPVSNTSSAGSWSFASVGLAAGCSFGTDGAYAVKGSSTTSTVDGGPPAGAVSADHVMVVFFGKMSGNNGAPTVAPDASVIVSDQQTAASTPNMWVGSYTGGTPEAQTITYAGPTANGAGVQVVLAGTPTSAAPTFRGYISGGVEVPGVTLRGIIIGGVEVAAGAALRGYMNLDNEIR